MGIIKSILTTLTKKGSTQYKFGEGGGIFYKPSPTDDIVDALGNARAIVTEGQMLALTVIGGSFLIFNEIDKEKRKHGKK